MYVHMYIWANVNPCTAHVWGRRGVESSKIALLGEKQFFCFFVCSTEMAHAIRVVIIFKAKTFPKILPVSSLRVPRPNMTICQLFPSKAKPFRIVLL